MDSDFPSGGGGGMGGGPVEEDFTKMALEDRLASKVWKARVSGYEELIRSFEKSPSESAPVFKPFTRNPDSVKAIVTDSNAVAQEKGVEAVRAFLKYGGKAAGATREVVLPSLVEKCFGAMRAGTKKVALEVVQLYAEMEDVMGCEGLIQDLIKGTMAKQPKVVATSVLSLCELVRDFGPKQASPKSIVKKLPDLFGHSDKLVRAEASTLAKELHKWIGAALEPTMSSLKDIQAKELREQFAQLDSAGERHTTPTRYLSSQVPAPETQVESAGGPSAAASAGAGAEASDEPIDPLEFAEPSDPLKAKDWPENFDEMIASPKWLERKDVLAQCLKVLEGTPKMIHTMPIDSIIDVLCEKVKKDSNINVALVACQCLTRLATGLRGDFAKNKDKALPALLEKLKEKKESTVKIVSDTLDAVFLTVNLGEILEQTLNAAKHKNPAVKAGSIQFLARCLKETRQMPAKGDVKPIAEALVTAMADGSADVREAGAQGLGTLMKLIGERAMNQFIDGLDDIKKGKIQDAFKEATVKVKQTSASSAPATAAAAPSRPPVGAVRAAQVNSLTPAAAAPRIRPVVASGAGIEKENVSPMAASRPPPATATKAPPARLAVKKPAPAAATGRPAVASSSRPAATSNGAAGKPGKAASASDPIKYRFHQDEADAKAAETVPSSLVEEISNSVWKDRLAGMVKFNEWLKIEAGEVESELIVRFLSKKPGWKESNFQVMAEVYAALRMLAQECPTFARASVALSITPLCEKLGDMKLKGPAGETLTLYAEKTSFGFVLMQALTPLANIKAPKAIADSLLWVDESLLAFGTGGVDVRSVIEYLLTCLKSANAGVRTNATLVIRTLARFLGTALMTFLGDLNPQLRSTIEGEIEKASKEPPPAPTRFSEEGRAKPGNEQGANGGGRAAAAAEEDDALDSLIPRVDLDQIMPSVAIARSGDANWKERKEGLEEINAILDANTRLKPNIGEVGTALKLRFSDNNMQVRMLALDAIAKIATGMNKGFADHARTFVAPVTQVLADAKVPIRAAASKTLTAIAQQVGAGPMISGFCSVLESKVANPMLKQDLFTWLGQWFEANPPEKGMELNGLALPAIHCLDDKLAAVRKAAQSVLPYIIMRAGYKYVMEQTNSLKTASRNTVVPLVDAAKAQAMAKAPTAAAALAPPAARSTASAAPSAVSRMPNVVRKAPTTAAAVMPSSSSSPVEASSDVPAATPRKGVMKPPSLVGRSLKPAATPLGDSQRADPGTHDARPAAPRMSIVRRPTMTAPAAASSQSSAAKTPPFVSRDGKFKAAREKRETGRGAYWIGPEATSRPELVEVLRSQCEHHLGAPLLDSMFSKDHNAERDFLSALTVLIDYVSNPATAQEEYGLSTEEEAIARLLANSDLVFKYVAIRLTDNNTSISLKCIDLVEQLLSALRQQEYHMSDYEANAIVPCLIAKFGDPRAPFRDRIRQEVFRKLTFIYPPSKILMHYVEEGLVSKNVRVRTECLGELGYLFSKNGAQICSLPKTLPAIAQQISDRDNGVRTAALLAIGEVYKIVGEEETWRCVGKLPLKESGLLEERLKRTTAPARATPAPSSDGGSSRILPPSRASQAGTVAVSVPAATATISALPSPAPARKLPVPSRLARPTSTAPSGIQPPTSLSKGSRMMAPPGSSAVSGIARPGSLRAPQSSSSSPPPPPSASSANGTALRRPASSASSTAAAGEDSKSGAIPRSRPSMLPAAEDDAAVEQVINEILSSDSDRSVMALKQVDAEIQGLAPSLLRHADQLTIAFGKQLHRAFNVDRGVASNDRLKKNLLFTGISVFDNTRVWEHEGAERTLGSFITKAALISLLTELLQRLIETSGATDEETQAHGRYLNIIVLRTFSSCNLNVLFGACLAMLTEATEDLEDLQQKGDEAIMQKRVKFSELIVKCLWKITRKLNASLQEESIDPTILLQDLERFLQAIPPSEWKRRASIGMPLGEMPLRTVKVIITHIGSCFGEEALDLLEKIPNAEASHVYKFLLRVCDRNGAGHGLGVEEEENEAPASPAASRAVTKVKTPLSSPLKEQLKSPQMDRDWSRASSAQDDAEAAINLELRNIFDRIAQKSESRAAIRDLYLFQRKYPHKEANIQRSLQSTGPIFQKFIKRALANHAADEDQTITTDDGTTGMPEKRDSVTSLVSPTSARSSAAIDWPATAASLSRSSFMSPPSNRTSFSTFPAGLNASPNPSANGGGSPNPRRDSATDDRLAQLRAKFARSTSGASESSVG